MQYWKGFRYFLLYRARKYFCSTSANIFSLIDAGKWNSFSVRSSSGTIRILLTPAAFSLHNKRTGTAGQFFCRSMVIPEWMEACRRQTGPVISETPSWMEILCPRLFTFQTKARSAGTRVRPSPTLASCVTAQSRILVSSLTLLIHCNRDITKKKCRNIYFNNKFPNGKVSLIEWGKEGIDRERLNE